jgi:ribosomal protein S18 acetylase RimI-like enzyme
LEELLYFNPRQYRVRDGIEESLARFGVPRLEEGADGLSIRVGDIQPQVLFAFDTERSQNEPVGVVVFIRARTTDLTIVHLAVDPKYALRSEPGRLGLGLALVEKVKEIGRSIAGVQRIVFLYREEVVMMLSESPADQ